MSLLNVLKKYRFVLWHILAWLVYIALGTLNKSVLFGRASVNLVDILLTQLPGIYVFYGSNFVFFRFLSANRYLMLAGAEILFFITYLLFFYIIGDGIAPVLNPGVQVPPFRLGEFVIAGLWVFFRYSYFSFGYYFARRAIAKEKELRTAEREKLEAEQGRLQAEYAFLRAQINPHFLHNTLNFFYAKSLGTSKELSDGILTLCEIMRYSLKSGEDGQGTTLLSREVEHVQHVIRINQLRFSNRLQVIFDITGDIETIRIIPLVLITLVENAFKHGDLTNKEHPLTIKLKVSEDSRQLYFSTYNLKKKGPKELSHGIGMDNIRKRLHAAYRDNYSLQVQDQEDSFTVTLSVIS